MKKNSKRFVRHTRGIVVYHISFRFGADRHIVSSRQKKPMKAARRKGEWMEVLTGPVDNSAVEAYMHEQLGFPAKLINKLKSRGGILQHGDRLRIELFPKESAQFPPQWHDIGVLYEDDFSLAVSKPAGMPVHPAAEGRQALWRTPCHFIMR